MASPVTTLPARGSTPSSRNAALCSLVLASTRIWAITALAAGTKALSRWMPGVSPSADPLAVLPSRQMASQPAEATRVCSQRARASSSATTSRTQNRSDRQDLAGVLPRRKPRAWARGVP